MTSGEHAERIWTSRYRVGELHIKRLMIATALIAAWTGTALAQDVEAGEASFRKCAPCHSVAADAANKVGPVLNGLDGRKAGAVDGLSYSDANKNSGITWNEETFKEYTRDPRPKNPGTKMIFASIKNEKELNGLWGYL